MERWDYICSMSPSCLHPFVLPCSQFCAPELIQVVYDLGIKRGLQKGKMTWPRRAMIFYRTRQSWLPRKLFSLEPGKLVLCICNDQQLACYPSLPRCHPHPHPHPPLPRRPAQRNILNLRRKTGRCLVCLSGLRYMSVWALCFLIILLKFWVLISMVSRQGSPSKSNCWKYKKTLITWNSGSLNFLTS